MPFDHLSPRVNTRRRIAMGVLLIGLAGIGMWYLPQRPHTVTVIYHLGANLGTGQNRLMQLSLSYRNADKNVVAWANYDFRQHVAASTQRHSVTLIDGEYRVTMRFSYGNKPAIVIDRLLLIEGEGGEVSIYSE